MNSTATVIHLQASTSAPTCTLYTVLLMTHKAAPGHRCLGATDTEQPCLQIPLPFINCQLVALCTRRPRHIFFLHVKLFKRMLHSKWIIKTKIEKTEPDEIKENKNRENWEMPQLLGQIAPELSCPDGRVMSPSRLKSRGRNRGRVLSEDLGMSTGWYLEPGQEVTDK